MLKSELRKIIRERKCHFVRRELDEMALAVIRKLKRHQRLIAAKTIMLYYSLPDEVNTHGLISELTGKTVLLPRVKDNEEMEVRIYSEAAGLSVGKYGIMEPCGPVFNGYDDIDLVIVPGMAFDRQGHRLGRGKGYYDRFLPQLKRAYKIGICFDFQVMESVPTEPTDISMDEVIS